MHLPITVAGAEKEIVETEALLDSGAGGIFINQRFIKNRNLTTSLLQKPILVKNIDGTLNKNGTITRSTITDLSVNGKRMKTRFLVTGLGKETIILGLPWLQKVNPDIDWKKGTFQYRNSTIPIRKTTIEEIPVENTKGI
jgi:imidazole glycerol phosphate synthase subunit HisF